MKRTTYTYKGPNLGSFLIDPKTEEFKQLAPHCDPRNPFRCLISTWASIYIPGGTRFSAKVDHENQTGELGITHGKYRWTRPMRDGEAPFACGFDWNKRLRKPLWVSVDLSDGTWTRRKKSNGGGAKTTQNRNGAGDPKRKAANFIRQRTFEKVREALEASK